MPWWLHIIDGGIWTLCVEIDITAVMLWLILR
jgi:hypothetical protein